MVYCILCEVDGIEFDVGDGVDECSVFFCIV